MAKREGEKPIETGVYRNARLADLTEALNNLSDAENARAEFLDGNQENEALGFGEDEEHSNADVVAAIENASQTAQDDVDAAENAIQDAEFDLDAARKEEATSGTPGDQGEGNQVDLSNAIDALDTLEVGTRLRDATIDTAADEAQTQVDESEVLYSEAGEVLGEVEETFDLNGDAGAASDQLLDLSGGVKADITIDLAELNDEGNKDDNNGGGEDTIVLPKLSEIADGKTVTINNMNLGEDSVVLDGLADADVTFSSGTGGNQGLYPYLNVEVTTGGGGSVVFNNLINSNQYLKNLTETGAIKNKDGDAVTLDLLESALLAPKQSADGSNDNGASDYEIDGTKIFGGKDSSNTLFKLTIDTDDDGSFFKINDSVLKTVMNGIAEGGTFGGSDLADLLGDSLIEESGVDSSLEDYGYTASDLQDNVNDAKDAVDSFVSANGDNEALLDGVRDAINAHLGAGGDNEDITAIDGNGNLIALRKSIADILDVEDGEEVVTEDVNGLIAEFKKDAVFSEPEKDLTDEQIAVNNAFDKVTDRVELDEKVDEEEGIFEETAEGGVLKDLTDLQEARQELKDEITKAEEALTQAENDVTEIDGLVAQLESLDGDIEEAQNKLTDSEEDGGYGVNLVEFGQNKNASATEDDDVILFSGAEDGAEINGFGAQGQDQLYFGEKYSDATFVKLGEDDDITGSVGDAGELEIFWEVDNSDNLTLFVENEAFGGSAKGQGDLTEITLNGVGEDVDTENGFLTAGTPVVDDSATNIA